MCKVVVVQCVEPRAPKAEGSSPRLPPSSGGPLHARASSSAAGPRGTPWLQPELRGPPRAPASPPCGLALPKCLFRSSHTRELAPGPHIPRRTRHLEQLGTGGGWGRVSLLTTRNVSLFSPARGSAHRKVQAATVPPALGVGRRPRLGARGGRSEVRRRGKPHAAPPSPPPSVGGEGHGGDFLDPTWSERAEGRPVLSPRSLGESVSVRAAGSPEPQRA